MNQKPKQQINDQKTNRAPESAIVETPKSVSNKIDPKDSTYLIIKLRKTGYTILFWDDSLSTSNITLIHKFISTHLDKIHKEKILVVPDSNIPNDRFKELRVILKEFDFLKFQMTTEPDLD